MTGRDDPIGEAYLLEARRQLQSCAQLVRHVVDQLDDAQVWWRPDERMNSIGNLLLHLGGNIHQRLLSLVGGQPDTRNRQQEFDERRAIPKGELMARFDETIQRSDELLGSLDPARLLETRRYQMLAGEVEGTLVRLIMQTLVHLGGHSQEIVALARLQLRDRYRFQKPRSAQDQRK